MNWSFGPHCARLLSGWEHHNRHPVHPVDAWPRGSLDDADLHQGFHRPAQGRSRGDASGAMILSSRGAVPRITMAATLPNGPPDDLRTRRPQARPRRRQLRRPQRRRHRLGAHEEGRQRVVGLHPARRQRAHHAGRERERAGRLGDPHRPRHPGRAGEERERGPHGDAARLHHRRELPHRHRRHHPQPRRHREELPHRRRRPGARGQAHSRRLARAGRARQGGAPHDGRRTSPTTPGSRSTTSSAPGRTARG